MQREAEAATAEALDLGRRLGEVGASHAEALSRVEAEVAARLAEQDTFWQQASYFAVVITVAFVTS